MTRIIDKSNIKHKTLEEVKKEIRNSKSEVILEEKNASTAEQKINNVNTKVY